jgi:hypothetical protein
MRTPPTTGPTSYRLPKLPATSTWLTPPPSLTAATPISTSIGSTWGAMIPGWTSPATGGATLTSPFPSFPNSPTLKGIDLDVRLQPIALTLPQVKSYRLPRTPIKPSERRKASSSTGSGHRFENRFGRGVVELDALEALYPGKLAGIVETAICKPS